MQFVHRGLGDNPSPRRTPTLKPSRGAFCCFRLEFWLHFYSPRTWFYRTLNTSNFLADVSLSRLIISLIARLGNHFNSIPFIFSIFFHIRKREIFLLHPLELIELERKMISELCFGRKNKIDNRQTWLSETFLSLFSILIHRLFSELLFILSPWADINLGTTRGDHFLTRYQWCGKSTNMIYGHKVDNLKCCSWISIFLLFINFS